MSLDLSPRAFGRLLRKAICDNDASFFMALVERGADPFDLSGAYNYADEDKRAEPLICMAAAAACPQIVSYLLTLGASIESGKAHSSPLVCWASQAHAGRARVIDTGLVLLQAGSVIEHLPRQAGSKHAARYTAQWWADKRTDQPIQETFDIHARNQERAGLDQATPGSQLVRSPERL